MADSSVSDFWVFSNCLLRWGDSFFPFEQGVKIVDETRRGFAPARLFFQPGGSRNKTALIAERVILKSGGRTTSQCMRKRVMGWDPAIPTRLACGRFYTTTRSTL